MCFGFTLVSKTANCDVECMYNYDCHTLLKGVWSNACMCDSVKAITSDWILATTQLVLATKTATSDIIKLATIMS